MHQITGPVTCQAATFVYKDDRAALKAWQDVAQIPHIRAEIHDGRASFLAALRAWNTQPMLVPDNAYLGIYAHMGQGGISPKRRDDPMFSSANVISWQELAAAIPERVHTCWLVGCDSKAVLSAWKPFGGPVLGRLLVTLETNKWRPLVELFAQEISLDPINYPEDMLSLLRKALPELGTAIEYYEPTALEWTLFFPKPRERIDCCGTEGL